MSTPPIRSLVFLSILPLLVACAAERDPVGPSLPSFKAAEPPSGTSAVVISESQIDISWLDNSSNESGFEVQRSTAGASGPFAVLASTGAGVTRYSDEGLTPSTPYCYKVRAFGATSGRSSYSKFSAASCATTSDPSPPPSAPSGVSAALYLDQRIEGSWADNSSNEVGFRVERSTDGGLGWLTFSTIAVNRTSFVDYTFPSEQQICYRVFAFNGMGDSPPSNTTCAVRSGAPGPLTATFVDSATVDLAWVDNSSFEDGYVVLGTGCWGFFAPIAVLPANATSVRLDLGGGCWVFYVRALNGAGYSYPSEQLEVSYEPRIP
jgi:titin